MKKKSETPMQGYLSSIVAFIIATALGIVVFSVVSQRAVDKLAQTKLTLNVTRQSSHFEDILDVNYQFLDGIAAQISSDGSSSPKRTGTCCPPSSPRPPSIMYRSSNRTVQPIMKPEK